MPEQSNERSFDYTELFAWDDFRDVTHPDSVYWKAVSHALWSMEFPMPVDPAKPVVLRIQVVLDAEDPESWRAPSPEVELP